MPLRYDQLVAWYAARTPADIHSTYYAGATSPAPAAEFDWPTRDSSRVYSTPIDVVDYARLSPHVTAIRTDVTLAARADRTDPTLVPATVTRLDVTKKAIDGPDPTPKTISVTDHDHIVPVVNAFDRLRGDYVSNGPHGCGSPVGIVYTYAVTFDWPGHTLIVDAGAALCGIGRGLTRDGHKLPQTLQDDTTLDNALQAAYNG